jgi:hypothetical protein
MCALSARYGLACADIITNKYYFVTRRVRRISFVLGLIEQRGSGTRSTLESKTVEGI